jgi:hypothetical protein
MLENLDMNCEAARANAFSQETSDIEEEHMREKLRTILLRAETLQKEMRTAFELLDDEAADREYERARMIKTIEELHVTERENRIYAILTDHLRDGKSNESEPESDYDDERAEDRSEGAGTSSATVPPAGSMPDGRTDGQSEICPICLCGFVTQDIGTPEGCRHNFCAACLQQWLKTTNTCPIDRQVCDAIVVRRCLGGEVIGTIHVDPPEQQEDEDEDEEGDEEDEDDEDDDIGYPRLCVVCGNPYSSDKRVQCARCGNVYHLMCLYPNPDIIQSQLPRSLFPWFCSDCE